MELSSPEAGIADSPCPECDGTFTAELQRCSVCGFSLLGVKLYNPRYFIWWAMLFSGLTTIYMAGTNLGKMGRRREKWLWLGLGFAGFVSVFGVLSVLPDVRGLGRLLAFGLNLPIGWYLRVQQKGLFERGLSFGARKASSAVGVVLGTGVTLLALALAVTPMIVQYEVRFQSSVTALSEDRCVDARLTFQELVDSDPEDTVALFNLGVAELCLADFDSAATRFRDYTAREPSDPRGHAMLAYCFWLDDRDADARHSLERALSLDPGVLETLGIQELASIRRHGAE